jgi:hypothetical protein
MNLPAPDLHAELEQRLRFEMLLSELSARFVGVTEESIDDEIVDAQRQIVEALDLDRSVLAQLNESGDGFVYTHCWFRPGLEPSSRNSGLLFQSRIAICRFQDRDDARTQSLGVP